MAKKKDKATRQARTSLARLQSSRVKEARMLYEAAAAGRRTQHWRTGSLDANSEILDAVEKVRGVARDLVRNNAYATRAKALIVSNTVAAGIIPRMEGVGKKQIDAIRSHLESTDVDSSGLMNLYGLQALAMGAVVESGEVLVRRRPRRAEDGLALPFQLQILEPDYLDTSKDGRTSNGLGVVIGGIEFDQLGRRRGYWLFDEHPGANVVTRSTSKSSFVPAESVAHIFRVDRPGQARGISWFAPVILRMRDFADFADAQLLRQKIAACFAAFITTAEGHVPDSETPDAGSHYPSEVLEPGIIERLRDGESITFANPPSTGDFGSYSDVTLREIAVGLGVPTYALSGDLARVNFSAGRLGWIEFQNNLDAWRWLMLIPQMLGPLERWINEALVLREKKVRFQWAPPRRQMIDPATEVPATRDAIRCGLTSRSAAVRELGFDPLDVDRENAEDAKRADELELIYDSDPRHTTSRGQIQGEAAPQPAAPAAPADQGEGDQAADPANLDPNGPTA